MKSFALLPALWICTLAIGALFSAGTGAPTDSLWLKAVTLSEKNDDLVPGLLKMIMQEVDKHGEPKDEDKYREVWSTLKLGEDGEVEYEMIRAIKDGEDITEEEKAKEKDRETDEDRGDDEGSRSHEMEGYSPFGPESQTGMYVKPLGDGGIVGGRHTMEYEFTDRSDAEVVMKGKAWLEKDTGIPVRIEYTPDPLPKRVKRMMTTMEYEHISPDSLIVSRMYVEVTGGILFIKKHFHMNMTFDRYWRLPEGYDDE